MNRNLKEKNDSRLTILITILLDLFTKLLNYQQNPYSSY